MVLHGSTMQYPDPPQGPSPGGHTEGVVLQLQDRTQFSDEDLLQLRRYWNRGMTSLGFVCREKITAAANHLNVDTEIVKVSGTLVLLNTGSLAEHWFSRTLVL